MEGVGTELDKRQLLVGDFLALGVLGDVDLCADFETFFRGCVADQADNDSQAFEWPASPVLGDMAEHAVLDFIPFAGARRQVAHLQREVGFIGKSLQCHFP